jgi:L-lactate dehydrogenase (cytochrome)
MSILSIEDVVEKSGQAVLVPALCDARPRVLGLADRARQGGQCPALVLTLDLQVQGQRHRDLKNGLAVPPKLTLANMLDIATKPGWAFGMLGARRKLVRQPRGTAEEGGKAWPPFRNGSPGSSTRR